MTHEDFKGIQKDLRNPVCGTPRLFELRSIARMPWVAKEFLITNQEKGVTLFLPAQYYVYVHVAQHLRSHK